MIFVATDRISVTRKSATGTDRVGAVQKTDTSIYDELPCHIQNWERFSDGQKESAQGRRDASTYKIFLDQYDTEILIGDTITVLEAADPNLTDLVMGVLEINVYRDLIPHIRLTVQRGKRNE